MYAKREKYAQNIHAKIEKCKQNAKKDVLAGSSRSERSERDERSEREEPRAARPRSPAGEPRASRLDPVPERSDREERGSQPSEREERGSLPSEREERGSRAAELLRSDPARTEDYREARSRS